ncbi:hypothetical protein PENTCL1PPCAC_18450 [Pristionchus entomophagus]|uniref:Peptidase S9 prolyl oligopeptidase catalytic domain-containing protein n=1 Tax=Pristionchus entomophagus TaxID=358040 RepID=A0AAV5TPC3_9BILA|nr:hypothetical protein PENTCL1PPCAC_18450 [Pristionchus entomophagus]
MDCSCSMTKCEGCEKATKRVTGCLQTIGRACWVVCLPPLPNLILNRAAFWPPTREYFFFEETLDVMDKKNRLRTANKSSIGKKFIFGFEHPCYKPLKKKNIECFTVETRKKHYIACVRVKVENPRYTLLYSHPNGSDLSDHMNGVPSVMEIARFLHCNIVIYDYSGYGISSGSSNEKSLFADIEAVYQHMITKLDIKADKIIFYGYSIGTAASIALLTESQPPVAGAILLSPLTSMLRVLVWKRACFNTPFVRRRLCIDKFRSIEKMHLVTCPVLVCHGKDDIVVPIEHGQAVHDKAPNKVKPLWIPDAGHNNLENIKEVWVRVRDFINNELTPATSQTTTPTQVTPLADSKPTVLQA